MKLNIYITLVGGMGSLLLLVIYCVASIFHKYLSIKRDKQFLDFINNGLPNDTHVTIAEGDTYYKVDKSNVTP